MRQQLEQCKNQKTSVYFSKEKQTLFGTFGGVFTPTLLTILG